MAVRGRGFCTALRNELCNIKGLLYVMAASVILFIELNNNNYIANTLRNRYKDKLTEIIQMQPQNLTTCNFTMSALFDSPQSYHYRYNIDTDTRPPIIFGNLDLYQDLHEFDGLQKVSNVVHQFFHMRNLSVVYQKWMQSWLKMNPGWQYWFWTMEDIKRFIEVRYPNFKKIFVNYQLNLQRYDSARYFILYEYGGFYADLDVECLKPLNTIVAKHNCIVTTEPAMHYMIVYNDRPKLLNNGIMASQPRHPFFEYVINSLTKNSRNKNNNIMLSTGPMMLDVSYDEFRCVFPNDSPYMGKPEEFQPIADPRLLAYYTEACRQIIVLRSRKVKNIYKAKEVCAPFSELIDAEKIPEEAYTVHYWVHSHTYGYLKDKYGLHNETRTFNVEELFS